MFDETLREDLLNIDVGANTIDTINYRRNEILKICKQIGWYYYQSIFIMN